MIIAQELKLQQDISADVIFPPSDLYSDEPSVETELHLEQIMLLIKCLKWLWKDRYDFYAAGNLTTYYSPHQKKSKTPMIPPTTGTDQQEKEQEIYNNRKNSNLKWKSRR